MLSETPERVSDSWRERSAVFVLIGHLAWWLVALVGATTSAISFCDGNDDCHGLWIFLWGMPWVVGELLFALPVIGAASYLSVHFWRGSRAAPMIGLSTLVAIPVSWLIAGLVLSDVATS